MKIFKTVQWMREQRVKIDEEDQGLSWQEKRKKTHEAVLNDPILKELSSQVRSLDKVKVNAIHEKPGKYGLDTGKT